MAGLLKFMVVHNDPNISWIKVEENWRELAKVESATWGGPFSIKKKVFAIACGWPQTKIN